MLNLLTPPFQTQLQNTLSALKIETPLIFLNGIEDSSNSNKTPILLVASWNSQWSIDERQQVEDWCKEQRTHFNNIPFMFIVEGPSIPSWIDLVPFQPCDFCNLNTKEELETRLHHLIQSKPQDESTLFMGLFKKHPAIMLLIDSSDGSIIDGNPSALDFYGYSENELKNLKIFDINQASDMFLAEQLKNVREGKKNHFYFKHRLRDGSSRSVEVHTTPFTLNHRKTLLTVVQDISHHKQTEEALQASENRYRQMVETAEEGIITLDEHYRISFVNQKMLALLGAQSHSDLLGKHLDAFLENDALEYYKRQVERLRKGITQTQDIRVRTFQNELIWVSASTSLLFTPEGKYNGLMSFITDITPRKKWEKTMKASLEERDVLLKEVSHRVKNNFQMMMSLLNLQQRATQKDSPEYNLIQAASSRIYTMALVHEQAYEKEGINALDLEGFVRLLIRETSAPYPEHRPEFVINIAPITLDLNQAILCSLILNELLKNCLEYAIQGIQTPKTQITINHISTKDNGPSDVELVVKDNGNGFSEAHASGYSQGISLVKHWSKQLDGEVSYTSSDKGTQFSLTFPIK